MTTTSYQNTDLEDVEIAMNREPRQALVLLLDTSSSMSGASIGELNQGLKNFADYLKENTLTRLRVEVSIITFDSSVKQVTDFATVDYFDPPTLATSGLTSMAEGLIYALNKLEERKQYYDRNELDRYRPWIWMVTDGGPTDEEDRIAEATRRVQEAEKNNKAAVFGVGVVGANMECLAQLLTRAPLKLHGLDFDKMLLWLSNSMAKVSGSTKGDSIALDDPMRRQGNPNGWGEITT
jgi:uncharacterized protein YegL